MKPWPRVPRSSSQSSHSYPETNVDPSTETDKSHSSGYTKSFREIVIKKGLKEIVTVSNSVLNKKLNFLLKEE